MFMKTKMKTKWKKTYLFLAFDAWYIIVNLKKLYNLPPLNIKIVNPS